MPLLVPADYVLVVLAVATVAFVIPFTESGVCITLLLTRLPYGGGWLYAADLAGAALGCLGVIFVLLVIDPVSATLWIGALAAGAGWMVVRGSGDVRSAAPERRRRADAGRRGRRAYRARRFRQEPSRRVLGQGRAADRNAVRALEHLFARAGHGDGRDRAVRLGLRPRAGHEDRPELSRHRRRCGTVITRYDGDLGKLAYLKDDVINAAYLVQPPADVAVVGVGGGRDILSGAVFRRQEASAASRSTPRSSKC